MLNHQTVEKLHALRLTGMADAYRRQMEDATLAGLSFEERFGLLVDQHWTWRENQAMARRLRKSKLDAEPCVEDIDFRHPRGLDRPLMRTLISSQWVARHLSVLFIGSTGIGKSWLAQALAQKACRDGYTVLYRPAPKLFRDLMIARADGSLGRVLENIARTDVLVVDDFAMAPLNEQERRDFLEICDDRYNRRSTVLTSQLPVTSWHQQIGDPTVADSILDRLVHNAYRIELSGESIRKKKGPWRNGRSAWRWRMSTARLVLKQPTGWFAAGREVAQALALLSDGAFKLYIHLCLEADRHTGRAVIDPGAWTQILRNRSGADRGRSQRAAL